MKKIIKNNLLMINYVAKYCPNHIGITLINSILSSVSPVFFILYTRYIINSLSEGLNLKKIVLIILSFMIFNIAYSYFNTYIQHKIVPRNTQILNKNMQTEIFNKTLELDLECYENAEFYNKFNMALQQSDTRALAVLNTFSTFIGSIFGIVSLVTLISSFAPVILIVIMVNVLITFYISTKTIDIQHKYYKQIIPYQRETEYAKRMFYLREYAKEIRIYNEFPTVIITNFKKAVDTIISYTLIRGKKVSNCILSQSAMNALSNAVIMLFLAFKVVSKYLIIGDFIALSSSAQQLALQISQTLNLFNQM